MVFLRLGGRRPRVVRQCGSLIVVGQKPKTAKVTTKGGGPLPGSKKKRNTAVPKIAAKGKRG